MNLRVKFRTAKLPPSWLVLGRVDWFKLQKHSSTVLLLLQQQLKSPHVTFLQPWPSKPSNYSQRKIWKAHQSIQTSERMKPRCIVVITPMLKASLYLCHHTECRCSSSDHKVIEEREACQKAGAESEIRTTSYGPHVRCEDLMIWLYISS